MYITVKVLPQKHVLNTQQKSIYRKTAHTNTIATSSTIRVLNVHYSTWYSKDYTSQIMSLKQWCHCEWGGLTLNWSWKAVSWLRGSFFFILVIATLRLVAAICVSPHMTDSKIASWMNANCSWTNKAIQQLLTFRNQDRKELTYQEMVLVHLAMQLTGVWTIFILLFLILVMAPGTSTTCSFSICSRMLSMATNVPVRPTPALQ